MFVFRFFDFLKSDLFLTPSELLILNKFGFFIIFSIFFIFRNNSILTWIFFVILCFLLIVIKFIIQNELKKRFDFQLVFFLDLMILNLQMGTSFRSSFKKSIPKNSKIMEKIFKKILDSLINEIPPKNFALLHFFAFYEQMYRADHTKSKVIDRLKSIRGHFFLLQKLKLKSSQIQKQVGLQSLILSLLYFGLIGFVIFYFGFWNNQNIIMISLLLYGMGLGGSFYLGLKKAWKV